MAKSEDRALRGEARFGDKWPRTASAPHSRVCRHSYTDRSTPPTAVRKQLRLGFGSSPAHFLPSPARPQSDEGSAVAGVALAGLVLLTGDKPRPLTKLRVAPQPLFVSCQPFLLRSPVAPHSTPLLSFSADPFPTARPSDPMPKTIRKYLLVEAIAR